MPEYLTPGVYIEEFEIGAKPIEGVSTSTIAAIGEAERGSSYPTLVTSFPEYKRMFGGFFGQAQYLPHAVEGFFSNGGKRCYITRVVSVTGNQPAALAKKNLGAVEIAAVGEGT